MNFRLSNLISNQIRPSPSVVARQLHSGKRIVKMMDNDPFHHDHLLRDTIVTSATSFLNFISLWCSGVADVRESHVTHSDSMPSYFLAETVK